MLRYVLRRLLTAIPTLFVIITISFFLMHVAPGGPFNMEKGIPPEIKANIERVFHLDEPIWMQYLRYLNNLLHGDLGPSYILLNFSVAELFRVGLPVSIQIQISIRIGADGRQWLVFLYFVIWASDIGAYAIGIPFGKHRLYEKVSPKKSIEGFVGALAASAGMALLCRVWFMPFIGMGEIMGIALVLAVVGTIGDLVESLFKRSAGVKDSGNIIPGHGGILDRMDSMLFAAPVLYYYLRMR